jgi:hypothetical protein
MKDGVFAMGKARQNGHFRPAFALLSIKTGGLFALYSKNRSADLAADLLILGGA